MRQAQAELGAQNASLGVLRDEVAQEALGLRTWLGETRGAIELIYASSVSEFGVMKTGLQDIERAFIELKGEQAQAVSRVGTMESYIDYRVQAAIDKYMQNPGSASAPAPDLVPPPGLSARQAPARAAQPDPLQASAHDPWRAGGGERSSHGDNAWWGWRAGAGRQLASRPP